MRALGIALLASLASCDGCTERTPGVCCTSDPECARLGLPPGSAPDYSCGAGHVCRDFYCVPEEPPDAPGDAAIDAPSGRCDPNAPFGAPTRVPNLNNPQVEDLSVALTGDQLKAYLVRSTSVVGHVVLTSKRASAASDFPAPTTDPALVELTSLSGDELYLYPSFDDLVLYYRRDSTWFVSSRLDPNGSFDSGSAVYANGAALSAGRAMPAGNSATLYWSTASSPLRAATRGINYYTFTDTRAATIFDLTDFAITADELTLYYSNYPNPDIFRTTRTSKNVPFDVGIPVANVNTTGVDIPLYVSQDDCFLYIRSGAVVSTSENDIWIARRGQ